MWAVTGDADDDGVVDELDRCPTTTTLSGPIPTEKLCRGCMGDDVTIDGCNASDILSCKPVMNLGEIKHGISPGTQKVFSKQKGWAKDCFFDEPPEPLGDVTGTVLEGTELRLELFGATLIVPAGSLPAGVEITLSVREVVDMEPPPNAVGETPLSKVFSIAFSSVVPAAAPLNFIMPVSGVAGVGVYSLVRIVGGFATENVQDTGWMLGLGKYDAEQSMLSIFLSSAAEEISLIAVTQGNANAGIAPHQNSPVFLTNFLETVLSLLGVNEADAQQPSSGADTVYADLLSRGWAVVCRSSLFTGDSAGKCVSGSLDLRRLGNLVYESAETLSNLGFQSAHLLVVSRDSLEASGLNYEIVDPQGRSATSDEFFVLVTRPEVEGGGEGFYLPGRGELLVRLDSTGDTAIHELMHSVQWDQLTNPALGELGFSGLWNRKWIIEGTGAAVEPFAPDSTLQDKQEFRYADNWRNWAFALFVNGSPFYYEVAEFWLFLDGQLSYLANLFSNLRIQLQSGDIDFSNDYAAVDQALQWAGGPTLFDGYLALLQDRSNNQDYPHCEFGLVFCENDSCSLSDVVDLNPASMSGKCFAVEAEFVNSTCPDPEIEVELIGDIFAHRFFVDGQLYEPGQTAEVGQSFQLWTANLNTENISLPPPDAIISIVPCVCGDGVKTTSEECDDGNLQDGDGCSSICMIEPLCGDGITEPPTEECDDGNLLDQDGCSSSCLLECGNGVLDAGEACDDGNRISGDGCSALCEEDIAWIACSSNARQCGPGECCPKDELFCNAGGDGACAQNNHCGTSPIFADRCPVGEYFCFACLFDSPGNAPNESACCAIGQACVVVDGAVTCVDH